MIDELTTGYGPTHAAKQDCAVWRWVNHTHPSIGWDEHLRVLNINRVDGGLVFTTVLELVKFELYD